MNSANTSVTLELSFEEIRMNTLPSLLALGRRRLPVLTAQAVADNIDLFRTMVQQFERESFDLLKQKASMDAEGRPLVGPEGKAVFPSQEAQEEYMQAMREKALKPFPATLLSIVLHLSEEETIEPNVIEGLRGFMRVVVKAKEHGTDQGAID